MKVYNGEKRKLPLLYLYYLSNIVVKKIYIRYTFIYNRGIYNTYYIIFHIIHIFLKGHLVIQYDNTPQKRRSELSQG